MKVVVLDYIKGEVDVLTMSDTSTEDEIEEYLSQQYGKIEKHIEYLIVKDNLKINII